jgi:Protein of unknown function (DUF2948)
VDHIALRLLAQDESDLQILSAAAQDGIFQVADGVWLPSARRFTLKLQRYVWEANVSTGKGARVWAALSFDGVLGVKAHKITQTRRDAFASLLSIGFEVGEAPSGVITLNVADGGAIALEVECVDAVLADLGPAREAVGRPEHQT